MSNLFLKILQVLIIVLLLGSTQYIKAQGRELAKQLLKQSSKQSRGSSFSSITQQEMWQWRASNSLKKNQTTGFDLEIIKLYHQKDDFLLGATVFTGLIFNENTSKHIGTHFDPINQFQNNFNNPLPSSKPSLSPELTKPVFDALVNFVVEQQIPIGSTWRIIGWEDEIHSQIRAIEFTNKHHDEYIQLSSDLVISHLFAEQVICSHDYKSGIISSDYEITRLEENVIALDFCSRRLFLECITPTSIEHIIGFGQSTDGTMNVLTGKSKYDHRCLPENTSNKLHEQNQLIPSKTPKIESTFPTTVQDTLKTNVKDNKAGLDLYYFEMLEQIKRNCPKLNMNIERCCIFIFAYVESISFDVIDEEFDQLLS